MIAYPVVGAVEGIALKRKGRLVNIVEYVGAGVRQNMIVLVVESGP